MSEGTWYFITKGDANEYPDPVEIPGGRVVGVICGHIPFIGWIKIILVDFGIFIPLIIVLSVAFIWSLVKDRYFSEDRESTSDDAESLN